MTNWYWSWKCLKIDMPYVYQLITGTPIFDLIAIKIIQALHLMPLRELNLHHQYLAKTVSASGLLAAFLIWTVDFPCSLFAWKRRPTWVKVLQKGKKIFITFITPTTIQNSRKNEWLTSLEGFLFCLWFYQMHSAPSQSVDRTSWPRDWLSRHAGPSCLRSLRASLSDQEQHQQQAVKQSKKGYKSIQTMYLLDEDCIYVWSIWLNKHHGDNSCRFSTLEIRVYWP